MHATPRAAMPVIVALLMLLPTQPILGQAVPNFDVDVNADVGTPEAVNGVVNGACPASAFVRQYDVIALPLPISYDHWGDVDLHGELFVPARNVQPLLSDVAEKVAFAGLGDISTDLLAMRDAIAAGDAYGAVDASNALATSTQAALADGAPAPRDRIDTSDLVQPLVLRAHVGDCVQINLLNVLPEAVSIRVNDLVGVPGAGSATGADLPHLAAPGQTVTYQAWIPPWTTMEGAHFLNSMADSRAQTRHGLFGAISAEPIDATWTAPDGVGLGDTGLDAIINMPTPKHDFREFVQLFHDEAELVDWHLDPLPLIDPITLEYGPGTKAISLRTEPFYDRFSYIDELHAHHLVPRASDESGAYSSYVNGDPATHFQRSYLGDPAKFRSVNAGPGQPHVFHLHGGGIRWRIDPFADDTQFDAGLLKANPEIAAASQRVDVQNINPGESYTSEPEGGSGGVQQVAGDFLYHCHIAEHYLAGMWSFWRVYNTLQPDLAPLADRAGAIVPAVTSAQLVGRTVRDGTTITTANLASWVEKQLPARGVSGVDDASVWDWSIDTSHALPVYLGEPESAITSPDWKADAPGRLPAGERPAIGFDPLTGRLAFPLLRPHIGDRPPFAPEHGPTAYLPMEMDQQHPDGLCPTSARHLQYNVVATPADIKYNAFDSDAHGEVFALAEDSHDMATGLKDPTSLVLRANAGDCVDTLLTNNLHEVDDGKAATGNHKKTNLHIHLVQFDPQASDGVVAGFNFEQSLRALEGSSSLNESFGFPIGDPSVPVVTRLTGAPSFANGLTTLHVATTAPFFDQNGAPKIGSLVGVGLGAPGTTLGHLVSVDATAGTITLDVDATAHAASQFVGYEFVRYRWYADVDLGIVYFHDHVNGLNTWRHGLFGSLVVEPPASRWLDPARTTDVGALDQPTAHVVDIIPAAEPAYRELVLHYQDRACVDPAGTDCVTWSDPRLQDRAKEPAAFDLRSEPLHRRNVNAPFASDALAADASGPQGDPHTPILRAYAGDPVKIAFLYAGQAISTGSSTFGVTGHRFRAEENLVGSRTLDALSMGEASHINVELECGAGGCAHIPGDYLYMMTAPSALDRGAWGMFRVLGAADATLAPLPGRSISAPATIGAPNVYFDVEAIRSVVSHNMQAGRASTMDRFVTVAEANDPMAFLNGSAPLVLRAHAGDIIHVNLTNGLPAGSGRVGLHAGLVSAGPSSQGVRVGYGPEQTAAVGETISYTWVADRELGVADLVSLADPVHDPNKGLVGALVIEPADSQFVASTGQAADITLGDGTVAHEHVLLLSHDDSQFQTSTMPYLPDVQGRSLINYMTEPLIGGAEVSGPLGSMSLSSVSTCSLDIGCAPRPLTLGNPANALSTQDPTPSTPLVRAALGKPLILRVLGSAGDQQMAFHVEGHAFAADPDMANCRTDLSACRSNLVSTITVGARETRTAWIPAAGPGGQGDYLYGNQRQAFFDAGQWGILRVR